VDWLILLMGGDLKADRALNFAPGNPLPDAARKETGVAIRELGTEQQNWM
jgi:hypothetical protein